MIAKGLKKTICELLEEDPEILYSNIDIIESLKSTELLKNKTVEQQYKAIDNAFRNARNEGLILRHIDKDENNDLQYAFKIPKDKVYNHTPVPRTNTPNTVKKKRGQALTAKEIRSMFAVQYNYLAKLEDSCMAIVDLYETTEKEMSRIKSFLKIK